MFHATRTCNTCDNPFAQVWNETDHPRLVLIVDLWHHELETDAKRLATLSNEHDREAYISVVHRREYTNTTQRGH